MRPVQVVADSRRECSASEYNGARSLPQTQPTVKAGALQDAFGHNNADFVGCALWAGASLNDVAQHLTPTQRAILRKEVARAKFTGQAGQAVLVPLTQGDHLVRLMLVGLGEPSHGPCFEAGGKIAAAAASVGAQNVVVVPPAPTPLADDAFDHLVRGVHLGNYKFTAFSPSMEHALVRPKVGVEAGRWDHDSKVGLVYAESAALARDLINCPANVMTPSKLAAVAATEAARLGVECQILEPDELARRGMNLLMAVGGGSANTPRLVHLTYRPQDATAATPSLALVGKGITFDTGGLCIKPSTGMFPMKTDMGGAAAVLGAVLGAARLQAPTVVHGILALAENSISGTAYRPSDVYTSAAGKTVEVVDTDAEGRLALADALHYATQQNPQRIIDVATLTGACVAALGNKVTGLFSNNDALAHGLESSGAATGEPIWRLPLTPTLRHELQSPIADLKNLGTRSGGGAITAALFLQEFVGDTPWAHLDIAGPARDESGATGAATATLLHYTLRSGN